MEFVRSIQDCRKSIAAFRNQGQTIAFVPTMGALHEGHLSLVHEAKASGAVTVMSIFVNPLQFGPKEDFDRYPRPIDKDRTLAREAGVDLLFYPDSNEIYATDRSIQVEETKFSRGLCGQFRPGHFNGVCTVVLKLFNIVKPDRAYFGEKDAQQLRVIQKMVEDLNLDLEVLGCPTVREKDGLAMSSRNQGLTHLEREIAPALYAALKKSLDQFAKGERSTEKLLEIARGKLEEEPGIRVQYLELRRWLDFETVSEVKSKSILAIAAFLGQTRLIDNVILNP